VYRYKHREIGYFHRGRLNKPDDTKVYDQALASQPSEHEARGPFLEEEHLHDMTPNTGHGTSLTHPPITYPSWNSNM
jgi:hypothetical protein